MACPHYIIPPHLLQAIADSEANADKIRHAARQSLAARETYTKVRAERMAALAAPRSHQRQQIVPPHVLRSLSQSEEAEEHVRDRAVRDLHHLEGLMQQKLAPAEDAGTAQLAKPSKTSPKRSVYDAHHTSRESKLPGKLVRKEGDEAVKDKAVNEAFDNVGIVLDFYNKRFNWNSIDNRGSDVVSSVHFGEEYENAFWDPEKFQMVFGDGGEFLNNFTGCIDVIGHELTHAVTEHTSPLDYSGQPGALNEHISDVFGIMIKQQVQDEKADVADWLIGEDCILPGVKGVALRSMKAPGTAYDDPRFGKDPQPDNMKDYKVMTEDNGGVHVYSGIPNKAFYLASVAFGGYSWEKAGKIWWETMKSGKVAPKCQFKHFADLTVETAQELFDKEAAEIVRNAWTEVGVTRGV
ncbi:metalloprotease [Mariannaea sp. PMI_226]|nr:metalloprotease [Mariannaea sp. PMI_226]